MTKLLLQLYHKCLYSSTVWDKILGRAVVLIGRSAGMMNEGEWNGEECAGQFPGRGEGFYDPDRDAGTCSCLK